LLAEVVGAEELVQVVVVVLEGSEPVQACLLPPERRIPLPLGAALLLALKGTILCLAPLLQTVEGAAVKTVAPV
jgi:hypothetical protein